VLWRFGPGHTSALYHACSINFTPFFAQILLLHVILGSYPSSWSLEISVFSVIATSQTYEKWVNALDQAKRKEVYCHPNPL